MLSERLHRAIYAAVEIRRHEVELDNRECNRLMYRKMIDCDIACRLMFYNHSGLELHEIRLWLKTLGIPYGGEHAD